MNQKIKEIRHDWIPLKVGLRLAYRAWLPVDAHLHPVPAILEFLPYRKNDGTVYRDEITMPATAEKGYACIRVDLRGTGESDGLFDDEYSEQELSDAEQAIDWLSRQPWCDGNVGMVGISWGGFNALQVAYRQPPALKAIITLCSTDDRFNEDIHYAGGCLLNENLDWASFFWAYAQARCPDPRLVGENWKERWLERLENMPFLPGKWLAEQHKSSYWKHGSVSEDYSRIKIPVYAISGWADAYRNTVFRLLENLSSPCKGLVGPWAHKYPNIAYPDPKIDYVSESVRWWDRWLKNRDNGIMDEPQLQYYLMDPVQPRTNYEHREGSWQSEPCWPSPDITETQYFLQPGALSATQYAREHIDSIASPETTGQTGGKLMVGIGVSGEFPSDQQKDDEQSLTYDTAPLQDELNIVGQPIAQLKVSSDYPVANVIARLCDVQPDGKSTLITYGVLNLAHRESNENPSALVPLQEYAIDLALNHIAYRVPPGHRLRLAVSNAYWPLIWPSPGRDTLSLQLSDCSLRLPLKSSPGVNCNPALEEFVQVKGTAEKELRPESSKKNIFEHEHNGELQIETRVDYGDLYIRSSQTEIDFTLHQLMTIHPDDPNSARSTTELNVIMQQGDTATALKGRFEMTSTDSHFRVVANWQAWQGSDCIFERDFDVAIKRNLV